MTRKSVTPRFETVARQRPYGVLVYSCGCWCYASELIEEADEAVLAVGPFYDRLQDEHEAKTGFIDWIKQKRLRRSNYDDYIPWMSRLMHRNIEDYATKARKAKCERPLYPSFGLKIAPALDPNIVESLSLQVSDPKQYRAVVRAQQAWDGYANTVDLLSRKLPLLVVWTKDRKRNLKKIKTYKQLSQVVDQADKVRWRLLALKIQEYGGTLPPETEIGLGVFVTVIIPITDPVTDVIGVAIISHGVDRLRRGDKARAKNPVEVPADPELRMHMQEVLGRSGTVQELLHAGAREYQMSKEAIAAW